MTQPRVTTDDGSSPPAGLVEAVLAHESARVSGDTKALAGFLERGPHTVRVDNAGLVEGPDAIAAQLATLGEAGASSALELHVHRAGPGVSHVVSTHVSANGGRATVSQLWRQGDDGRWRIATAHVSTPGPAIDSRVWRLVGSPLITGAHEGPLKGETVAVKDLFSVAGVRRGVGVRAFVVSAKLEFETAPAVRALVDAGADVVGIAQTDQFAYSIAGLNPDYGTPPNAAVPGAIPGGSSSGPATAVALGQASIGLGTDTAGSIRVPASYQGLWGLRPTHGAIPMQGVAPLAPSYDTVGYLTRDGETLLAAASVGLAGAPFQRPGQRVIVPDGVVTPYADVQAAFREATAACAPNADRVPLPAFADLFEAFRVTQQAEAWRAHGSWVAANPGALGKDVASRFFAASGVTPGREQEALAQRERLASELDAILGDSLLLIPAAASAAPPLTATEDELEAARQATLGLTTIAGLTGRPALSIPVMRVPGGPVGISLVGPRGSDMSLIRTAILWARNIGVIRYG
ncbi:amidase family protein [Demequina sp.]|uniref:amidase family protein n=1 Tax=Demequina sp. TaxID=2050685 RepID=UPI003D0C2011